MLRFLFCLLLFHKASSEYGVLFAESANKGETDQFCIGYNLMFHNLPSTLSQQLSHHLIDRVDTLGCSDNYTDHIADTVVAVSRGNCSFVEKGVFVEDHRAFAVLVVSLQNGTQLIVPGINESNPAEYNEVNITIAFILYSDYQKIKDLGKSVRVSMYAPDPPRVDPNMALIFAIALFCIIVGPYWSGLERQSDYASKNRSGNISVCIRVYSFFIVCILLYFYDYLVYVVIGLFCLAGAYGLYCCAEPLWGRVIRYDKKIPPNRIPFFSSQPKLRDLVLIAVSLAVAIFWVVERKASYAWVLQDILGLAFCVNMLKTILLPSFRGCTILLVVLFFYDIFFVFITPYITKSGDSIMVDVATGGKSHSGEQLPMVFKVPRLLWSPLNVCSASSYSLLGFGDIILPGLLVSYNHRFDITVGSRKIYFIASVIAYTIGLVLTYIALALMNKGQPALLYLVPCTLIATAVIGWCRGELRHLWLGKEERREISEPKTNDDENPNLPRLTNIAAESEVSSLSSTEGERKGLINA
ncbi:signal peptide peptidase-like 2B [Gigantopelta aegis]|uniref:signal peptide peptidase-like 2B n=1 Tax=Gigantopelta aegis TaxID=1735272 RepID=UPI001B88CFF4|nr:signal peptide peptidase-like 2B [Gigantopelta aegis]